MDTRFETYGQTVCRQVRHATGREKQAIQAELAAHMEDHTQALMDAGYDEAHAVSAALEAMGDPEEVGKALNKEYPLGWLILSRLALPALLLLLAGFFLVLPTTLTNLNANLHARFAPAAFYNSDLDEPMYPIDIQWELPGDMVLSIYGVTLQPGEGDSYTAVIYSVDYSKNPFRPNGSAVKVLTFSTEEMSSDPQPYYWQSSLGDAYSLVPVTRGGTITAHYDRFGVTYEAEIPIPWEEVPG